MSWVSGLFSSGQSSELPEPRFGSEGPQHGSSARGSAVRRTLSMEITEEEEMRSPYWHCMLAGGVGGTSGDLLMHSIDTVKTRQQGDPHMPPKYSNLSSAYVQILRQEGVRRGLYGGVTAAMLGSFPGTVIFFGTYEYSKRYMISANVNSTLAYLAAGTIADLTASVVYVPSEVLKTRLQLQGRLNNPFFKSGYNYRSTYHAARTIVRQEGASALYHGYKATIFRDLPFSALQFAFYEQERDWAKDYVGSKDIGMGLEIFTAASAGGLAGTITCPFDVVKTKLQTQINPTESLASSSRHVSKTGGKHAEASVPKAVQSSSSATLNTSSILKGLGTLYQTEGVQGLFRGVGPRAVWTSVQSGTMLVMYQILLRRMAENEWFNGGTGEPA